MLLILEVEVILMEMMDQKIHFQVGEKYLKNNSGSNSFKITIWKSKGLSNQSLNLSGTAGTANDIKMSKLIKPAYVIFNHKESFFERKKKKIS